MTGYDWSRFYRALSDKGPRLLEGLDPILVELIRDIARGTDSFWSESLYETFVMSAVEGDLRQGVLDALEVWLRTVKYYLLYESGPASLSEELVESMSLRLDDPLVDELVEAAAGSSPQAQT